MPRLSHVSLFAGIGGIDLAAHWAGFETIQFVEREPFCQKVLAKNFPGTPIHDDVTTFDGRFLAGRGTLLSAGFPCQGISRANRHATGLADDRSGLFYHVPRIAIEMRAPWVLLENSPAIIDRGYDEVRRCMGEAGYIVSPVLVLEAEDVGLPQERGRACIVACLDSVGGWTAVEAKLANRLHVHQGWNSAKTEPGREHLVLRPDANACDLVRGNRTITSAPLIHRTADGIPNRLDRLRALGNAVNPRQFYPILKAIAEACA